MRVLLDTNVVLDLFLERVPFVEEAAAIWKAHEAGLLTAFVSAITPVNLFYIGRKLRGREVAARAVQELVMAVPIVPVNHLVGGLAVSVALDDVLELY
ncbi:MAG: PIN domain-containing protein [Anaerolineales bacterium]|nr:PIN domain-containing protein [Anaerolineales bacterium]